MGTLQTPLLPPSPWDATPKQELSDGDIANPIAAGEINPPPKQETQTKVHCATHSLHAPSPLLPHLFIHMGRQDNELFANEHPHLGAGTLAIAWDRPCWDHHARRRWQSTAVHPNYHHTWGHMGWWRLTFAAQYFDAKWHLRHKLFCKSWLGSGWVFICTLCVCVCVWIVLLGSVAQGGDI